MDKPFTTHVLLAKGFCRFDPPWSMTKVKIEDGARVTWTACNGALPPCKPRTPDSDALHCCWTVSGHSSAGSRNLHSRHPLLLPYEVRTRFMVVYYEQCNCRSIHHTAPAEPPGSSGNEFRPPALKQHSPLTQPQLLSQYSQVQFGTAASRPVASHCLPPPPRMGACISDWCQSSQLFE